LAAQGSVDVNDAVIKNKSSLRLFVAPENTQPTLRIVLPGHPMTDRAIEVVFPEQVTVRKHGSTDVEHIYMWQSGLQGKPPAWRQESQSLECEKDFGGGINLPARATLEDDGVLFHNEFTNRSDTAYDLIWAPTDPRLTSIFYDVRLERTYVHHQDGVDLLASEIPNRFSMPLKQWLPTRYKASFTWPVPAQRIEHGDDGITYYNKSRAVDQPLVATLSEDHKWVVASFSRATGNVWSNPELTCQHVDEESSLGPGGQAVLEVKILIFRGSLDQVLQKVSAQRRTLNRRRKHFPLSQHEAGGRNGLSGTNKTTV
jgi:hypothetical protein